MPELLKQKLAENTPENHSNFLRLHRAISWYQSAIQHKSDPDLSFITLWIAFNACYGNTINHQNSSERQTFNSFLNTLVKFDKKEAFLSLLCRKYNSEISFLLENKYAYELFWKAQNDTNLDWESKFESSLRSVKYNIANKINVSSILEKVLDRLYTVRNQLVHGNSTYGSSANRQQVRDASALLFDLMPLILDIMISNVNAPWGDVQYPFVPAD